MEDRTCASIFSRVPAGRTSGPAGALAPERCTDLLSLLAGVPDPRKRRGRQHRLTALLGIAVCAVLSGARSIVAIAEWAADAPPAVLVALGVRPDPLTGAVRAPHEATLRRVLARVDADALNAAVGTWLRQLDPPTAAPAVEPPTPRA